MFLFQLADEGLQELLLRLHLLNFSLHFQGDPFSHSSLVHTIAANLSKQFHVAHRSIQQTSLVETLTEIGCALLLHVVSGVLFPRTEELFDFVGIAPLVDPAQDDLLVAVSLHPGSKLSG